MEGIKGKISIIMGIFNCEDTLPLAIDSILNQTYTNWELIMCDDASSDATYSIAEGYLNRFPNRIKLLHNEKNMKLSYTLNRCLEVADGEFIARMDGDDISVPNRFEKQVAFLRSHPDVDLVGTAMQWFDNEKKANILYKPEKPDRFTLKQGNPFHHATILTYKRVYDKLEGYTVSGRTTRAQDYDLWFRFYYHNFAGRNLQEPLYLVREDINAIKRRTVKGRWNSLKTTIYGYNLLGYPKIWLIRPVVETIIKSMVPSKVILLYRKLQNYTANRQEN